MMNIGDVLPAILILVVAGIVASFGSTVLTDFQTDQTTDSYAYNATENALEGIDNISGQFGNLGLVIVAAIIIGVLMYAFGGSMRMR